MNKIKQFLKPFYHKLLRMLKWYRRIGLNCKDFSIISNNCSAGYVYQYYGLPYRTPTEGLGFSVDDYLKLVKNTRHYFTHELVFVDPKTTPRYQAGEHFSYPVAKIDDIFVYFRHYSIEKANEIWCRRCKRINFDKLFFLLTESDTFRDEHIKLFEELLKREGQKGIIFTSYESDKSCAITVKNVPRENGVPMWYPSVVIKSIDWKKVLNSL